MKRLVVTADDFGFSETVNEGIERAHRQGILTSASLMVAGAAVEDAITRARTMPNLRVGLHLVVIEGPSVLRHPALTNDEGWFSSEQLALGLRYFFLPQIRRLLAAEIRAQFAAFAATGLRLDHADAHKHMHLHPTVGAMLIEIGKEFGLPAIRIPHEPPSIMARCGAPPTLASRTLAAWTRLLRHQAISAGLVVNDALFGLAWTGAFTEERLLRLIPHLPDGLNELYFHPATARDALLDRWMPNYRHEDELAALLSPRVRATLASIAPAPRD